MNRGGFVRTTLKSTPCKSSHDRAAEFLSLNGNSIGQGEWVVRCNGFPLMDGWTGAPITTYQLRGRSAFGRTWNVYFNPGGFSMQLPADMNEVEASEVASSYIDLINMRRKGA